MSEEKIINRVKKMLTLANDLAATEGERDNALRMAYATMSKYNIDMATVQAFGQVEPRVNFDSVCFSMLWSKHIHQIVGELFFCKYFFGQKVNGTQCKHHFVGKESNAMTAAVIADFVVKSILKEARSMYKYNLAPESRSFALGAMHKLNERVKEIKAAEAKQAEQAATGTALVLANLYITEQSANEEFMAGYRLKRSKGRGKQAGDAEAYAAGQEFGAKINLSAQVGNRESVRIN